MKLNIGAGDTRYEGFVNIDYDQNSSPDYCFDVEKETWPFPDNSVDEVIAHHVLEHLGEGYFHVIKELYRVCQHGAMINIRVPHPRHWTFLDDPTHRRPITVNGLRMFSKKYNDWCKEQKSATSRLAYYLGVNFEIYDSLEIPDEPYIKLFQGKPVAEVERYMYENNNIIIETQVRIIAIKDET
jgi:SAM-dependent methyltransferase